MGRVPRSADRARFLRAISPLVSAAREMRAYCNSVGGSGRIDSASLGVLSECVFPVGHLPARLFGCFATLSRQRRLWVFRSQCPLDLDRLRRPIERPQRLGFDRELLGYELTHRKRACSTHFA